MLDKGRVYRQYIQLIMQFIVAQPIMHGTCELGLIIERNPVGAGLKTDLNSHMQYRVGGKKRVIGAAYGYNVLYTRCQTVSFCPEGLKIFIRNGGHGKIHL